MSGTGNPGPFAGPNSGAIGVMGIGIGGIGDPLIVPQNFDPIAVIDILAPGVVLQREAIDAVWKAWAANGFQTLNQGQVIAAVGALPPSVTSMAYMEPYF